MRKVSINIACMLALALVFSCQPKKQQLAGKPVTLESRTIQKQKGTDCDKQPDSLRTDCAIIDFSVPKIQGAGAQSALGKSMNAWADKFLIHLLTWSDYPEDEPSKALTTVDAAIKRFHAIHDEAEGSVSSGQFIAACTHGELLNDGKYLTLMLDGQSFAGGNRGINEVAIASFDVKTGKQLTWGDLVKDKAALLPIAQSKVQETRANAFKDGFKFDKEEPFALPSSYGLNADGLVMHYQSDEIYQLGGATEFTVPFSELGTNLKVAAPIAPADNTVADASDIYEVQGDSLVIPTFEIEVSNSPKAAKALKGKKASVVVSAYFAGYPSDKKDGDSDMGAMSILTKAIKLTGDNGIARFEGLKFSKKAYAKLAPDDKDISVAINVYSEQSTSKDNLLDCGLLEMKASNFGNKRYVLGCKLTTEQQKDDTNMDNPLACYALPPAEEMKRETPSFLVNCDSVGNISFADNPMKDLDALKAALRPHLKEWIDRGAKELPGMETEGCMMGNGGAIRDMYDELVAEMTGKSKPKEMDKADEKIAAKKGSSEASKSKTSSGGKSTSTTTKPGTKPVPSKNSVPTVTLNEKGEITLNDKKVTLDNLRKELQNALLANATIPDKLDLTTIGQTGMGMRGEVNTTISEAIAGAKWVRKKAAIAALNASIAKKLATATQLELGSYQLSGNFALIGAKPKQADGKAIDYSKTDYAKEAKTATFVNNVFGLLRYQDGAWKVLATSVGTSKAPIDTWVKSYQVPKAISGKAK